MQSDPQRRARGTEAWRNPRPGTGTGERSLGDVARSLQPIVLETIYGEIYQSPVTDSRTRQIVPSRRWRRFGTAAPQLRTHIGEPAVRAVSTREELVEIICSSCPMSASPQRSTEWWPAGKLCDTDQK